MAREFIHGWGIHSVPGALTLLGSPLAVLSPVPAGRDATRAFASGDFSPAGLVDSVSGLSPAELLSIHSWLSFYSDNYEPVGKLVGRFYDENGAPTAALREVEAAIEEALKLQAESDQQQQQFPPCNSEWSSAKGTRFWCSRESGGWYRGDSSYNIGILEDQSADQVRLDVKLIIQMSAIAPSPVLSLYKLEKN
nr:neuferricin [Zonotrichia albicollis]